MAKILSKERLAEIRQFYDGCLAKWSSATVVKELLDHIDAMDRELVGCVMQGHTPEFAKHMKEEEAVGGC